MKVLSLFDGMACGRMALERSGHVVDDYFAAEIKKDAIAVAKHNYPDISHLGDVRGVRAKDLPKIDLLIGGSPCQNNSRANQNDRTGIKGDKSILFWEFVRIWEELGRPEFMLENVIMPKSSQRQVSDVFGCEPTRINSSLLSAQLRDRLYWTSFGKRDRDLFGNEGVFIPQPVDRKILLKDVIEKGYVNRDKSRAILTSESRPLRDPQKMHSRYFSMGFTTIVYDSPDFDWKKGIRYFSQNELESLQTVTKGATSILSRNKAANLLGDGWTVDVISHIFDYL